MLTIYDTMLVNTNISTSSANQEQEKPMTRSARKNYKRRERRKKRKKQEDPLSSPSASQNQSYIMRAALQTPSFVATTLISSISRIAKKMRGGSTPSTSSLSISTTDSLPDEPSTPHILMRFLADNSSPLLEQPPASPSQLYQNNMHERDLHPTNPRIAKRLFVIDSETGGEEAPESLPREEGNDTSSSANHKNESADCVTQEFPSLSKYGIETNLLNEDNAKEISFIFSDLEALLKKYPNSSYNYRRSRGRARDGSVAFSSQFTDSKYFTKAHATAENRGLKNMIDFAGKNELDPAYGEPKGARCMLDFLFRMYPKSTKNFVVEKHTSDKNFIRLSPAQTAAILSKANISENAWYTVICRLIHGFTGFWISAPQKVVKNLHRRMPTPTFREYDYFQDPDKAPEKIQFWTLDIPELCEKLIERELEVIVEHDPERLPNYGYETSDGTKDGIFAIFSSDHGAGASLSAIRFLLEDSNKRREKGSADYGTVTFPFAHITCRKDPSEILELVKDNVNNGKNKLDSSKLVAVKDDKNVVRCGLIPKNAIVRSVREDDDTDNSCILEYIIPERGGGLNRPLDERSDESLHQIILSDFEGNNFQHWVAIQHFDTTALGDLLFALTVQGREGHASCKCMKCDKTQSQWKKDKGIPGIPLELDDLNKDNTDIGSKTDPTWEFSPKDEWIIPLLHLGMGLANVIYWNMVTFLLNEVDAGSPEEVEIRTEAVELSATLEVLRGELELYDSEYHIMSKDLSKRKASLAQRIKVIDKKLGQQLHESNERATHHHADIIATLNSDREVLEEKRRSIDKDREDLKTFKTSKNKELRNAEIKHQRLLKDVEKKVQERKKSNGGLDSQLEDVSTKRALTCGLAHNLNLNATYVNVPIMHRFSSLFE